MDDAAFMTEILSALIEDTSKQIPLLTAAIQDQDSQRCRRVAHYCKGACLNVGAHSVAALFKSIEDQALEGAFPACNASLAALAGELDRLRQEAEGLTASSSTDL
jgi:HPt (histidine-containing phosphotransfer) domain-containing protein